VRLFDLFHDGAPSPSTGGELVTVKGSHLVCTQVSAKCFPDSGRCQPLPIETSLKAGVNCYKIAPSGPPVGVTVPVEDQLAEQNLKIGTAQFVCAPFGTNEYLTVPLPGVQHARCPTPTGRIRRARHPSGSGRIARNRKHSRERAEANDERSQNIVA